MKFFTVLKIDLKHIINSTLTMQIPVTSKYVCTITTKKLRDWLSNQIQNTIHLPCHTSALSSMTIQLGLAYNQSFININHHHTLNPLKVYQNHFIHLQYFFIKPLLEKWRTTGQPNIILHIWFLSHLQNKYGCMCY